MKKKYIIYIVIGKERTSVGSYGHADTHTYHRLMVLDWGIHDTLEEAEAMVAKEISNSSKYASDRYIILPIYIKE